MSVILYGMDTDNPPYWYGWRVGAAGRASGFVDPAYRQDFFDELRLSATKIDVHPAWHNYTTLYAYESITGHGWHAYGTGASPQWFYSGSNPAMSLYVCCASPLTVPVAATPTIEAVAYLAGNSNENNNVGPFTVAADDENTAMYGFFAYQSASTVTPSWAGVNFTQLEEIEIGQHRAGLWRLLAPAPGSGPVAVHNSASLVIGGGVMYLSGVDQATPEADTAENSGTGQFSSLTLSAGSADLPLDFGAWLASNASGIVAPTAIGGQTEQWADFSDRPFGQADIAHAGGSGDATPAWDFGVSRSWVAVGAAVKGATG